MKKVCQIWEAGHVENGTEALIIYSDTSVSHFAKGLERPENHSFELYCVSKFTMCKNLSIYDTYWMAP